MLYSSASPKRIISLLLCLTLVMGFGFARIGISASADSGIRVSAGKAVSTSSGAFLQAYVASVKGVSTSVSFYKATGFDVYGFFGYYGGNNKKVKADASEQHLGGTDVDLYKTWSSDLSANPYQAFEADVSGVTGNVIVGYEGYVHEKDADGTLALQVWSPSLSEYVEVDNGGAVNGSIPLSAVIAASDYIENGRIRFRVVLPENADYKWIMTRHATVGQVDESVQYGATKTKTTPGNASYNYKGEITPDMYFCVKLATADEEYYSVVYPFRAENVTQNQMAHFNVNFYGDAGTGRNMSWVSENDLGAAVVQIVPYGKMNPDFSDAAEYLGSTSRIKGADKPYSYYVTVGGLEPGKEYWYRYGNGDKIWSDPCYLRTDDGDSHFSFIMGGDPQSYTDSTDPAQIEKVFGQYKQVAYSWNEARRVVGAEFLAVAGDESDHGNYEECWDAYYKNAMSFFRSSTLAPTMGNHDSWGWDMWIANHNLTQPTTGERGSYYSFDYGNAHIIVLNGNIAKQNNREAMRDIEYEWLENDLEAHKDADFKFILEHQGMYSYPVHTYEAETVEIRAMLVPLIDKYGVDVMLQGHDHVWLRTDAMKGGSKVTTNTTKITDVVTGDTYVVDPDGTTYINGGSLTGSKYHDPNPASFLKTMSIACAGQPRLPTFNTIEIDGGKLRIKGWVYNKDGSLGRIGDYFTYGAEKDGYNIVKTSYYTKINDRINALPSQLTLADREEVLELKAMCDAESKTFKDAYIPDADKLEAAYETVQQLWKDSVPVITVNGEMPSDLKTGKEYTFPNATAYDENDGDLPVAVTVSDGDSSATITDGKYIFAEEGEYTITYTAEDSDGHITVVTYKVSVESGRIKGDMDGDEEITVTDALAALRFSVRLAVPQAVDYAVGDMDGDGEITVTDALAILRMAAHLI